MPRIDNIDFRITVNDEPLAEYIELGQADESGGAIIRYIEATPGQTFKVVVKLLPGFMPHDAPYIHGMIKFDAQEGYYYNVWFRKGLSLEQGVLRKKSSWRFDHIRAHDDQGEWKQYPLSFGAVAISKYQLICPKFGELTKYQTML